MTCDQAQPLLEAFADGELGWGTAWRVRRHLAGCPACAAELAEVRQLDARVRAWRDVSAPAGLQDRVAATLPSAPPVAAPRRPVTVRRAAVGLTGVAVTAAAFFWLLPGQPGQPTIAFADVEQAMQQVQTVSYRVEEQAPGAAGKNLGISDLAFTYWLRRNPPALATTDYNEVASPGLGLTKTLMDERGALVLSKDQCQVWSELKVSAQRRVESQIKGLTQFPQAAPSSVSKGQARTTMTGFHQQNVVVNGQEQVRFDWDEKTVWAMSSGQYRQAHVTTWADPETHRIVRTETHVSGDTGAMKLFTLLVMDHFQYDQTPPVGVFGWSPPAGVRVVRMPSGSAQNSPVRGAGPKERAGASPAPTR